MKKKTDFTIDLSEKYPLLKIEISICKTEKGYERMIELFSAIGEIKYTNPSGTEATFFALNDTNVPAGACGLIFLNKGFDNSTIFHELFHAARWYFKLIGKRINENRDETFAHLLSDLVDKFENEYYGGIPNVKKR